MVQVQVQVNYPQSVLTARSTKIARILVLLLYFYKEWSKAYAYSRSSVSKYQKKESLLKIVSQPDCICALITRFTCMDFPTSGERCEKCVSVCGSSRQVRMSSFRLRLSAQGEQRLFSVADERRSPALHQLSLIRRSRVARNQTRGCELFFESGGITVGPSVVNLRTWLPGSMISASSGRRTPTELIFFSRVITFSSTKHDLVLISKQLSRNQLIDSNANR
jgi:hypothetical protein